MLHILIGPSGTGKTQWALSTGSPVVSVSDLREELQIDMTNGADRDKLIKEVIKRIKELLNRGENNVILNGSNLKTKERARYSNLGVPVTNHVFFKEPLLLLSELGDKSKVFKELAMLQLPKEFIAHYDKESLKVVDPLTMYANTLEDRHLTQHHLEKISEHIKRYVSLGSNPLVKEAGYYHDLGKYFTASPWAGFKIYANHEHMSAYIYRAIKGESFDQEVYETILNHTGYHDNVTAYGEALTPKQQAVADELNYLDKEARIAYSVLHKDILEPGKKVYSLRDTSEKDARIEELKQQGVDFDWVNIEERRQDVLNAVGMKFSSRTGEIIQ